jgi:hypothetical protein
LLIERFCPIPAPGILFKTGQKLIDILVIASCAVIVGADKWLEIRDYGKAKEDWFRTFLGLLEGTPSHETFWWIMSRIVPTEYGPMNLATGYHYQVCSSADQG